ncbi:MAG: hypothetical protein GY941_22240 [Planctomycetes bacterium]|nr:hypothetical protein [Planctomycetota bacterium]
MKLSKVLDELGKVQDTHGGDLKVVVCADYGQSTEEAYHITEGYYEDTTDEFIPADQFDCEDYEDEYLKINAVEISA